MKKLIVTLLIAIIQTCYSQPIYWSAPVTFTHGHVDKNPSFGSRLLPTWHLYYWEFLIFERHVDTSSNICVLKVGPNGPIEPELYLTSDNYVCRNSCIGYDLEYSWITNITQALALWETNKNGKWDIYGRYFNTSTGWQPEFPIDTSSSNKANPQTVFKDSSRFALVYERDGDIIFKTIDLQSNSTHIDTNLTSGINESCGEPKIANYNSYPYKLVVTYEIQKPNGDNAINYTYANSQYVWSDPDTVAYLGDNNNLGLVYDNLWSSVAVFESNRLGNWNLYGTDLSYNTLPIEQDTLIINPSADNFDFSAFFFPIITMQDQVLFFQAGAYVEKGQDSIRLRLLNTYSYYDDDSITIGDTTKDINITMNSGLTVGDALVWVIYNKDSASFSNLYGTSKIIIISNVQKLGNEIPTVFTLHQNYPNPFNPITNIRFDIPHASHVKLIIYDALGREVAIVVNEKLSAGSYETEWNGSGSPSGVYFYKLQTEKFKETKRMVLIK